MMAPHPQAPVPSTDIFQKNIFKGKVLFCTGGGSGICQRMTQGVMQHGASAFIVGRRESVLKAAAEALTQTTGSECSYASADVRHPETLKAAVAKCIDKFGRIDFVICGAAGNFLSSVDAASENAFKTVIEIDLLGTYNTVKATIPYIKETKGSYIHISATLHYAGLPFQAHASSAKAGVDALSRTLAVEYGPFGIRSNVIAPGPIEDTEGFSRLTVGNSNDLVRRIPIQRFGNLDDMANSAVFLFSPAASYITGTALIVDGGEYHTRSTMGGSSSYPDALLGGVDFRELKGKL